MISLDRLRLPTFDKQPNYTGDEVMLKKLSCLGIAIFLILSIPLSQGESHERYEKFIPINYALGMDEKYTATGSIVAVDKEEKIVTISANSESHAYKVTDDTKIWLDRSQIKAKNMEGSLTDLKKGLKAEIKIYSTEDKAVAKWIKVQIINN
ncbi:hypothetical protein NOC27_385 [Nitrosococcus oceani AFC27]|nr:hypothetical protein NOC27_385 [Nitrosococcus oceani AFC27]GEM20483.1 hypothetical protein NONS58_19010 [Nitrosococcus oceani]